MLKLPFMLEMFSYSPILFPITIFFANFAGLIMSSNGFNECLCII